MTQTLTELVVVVELRVQDNFTYIAMTLKAFPGFTFKLGCSNGHRILVG